MSRTKTYEPLSIFMNNRSVGVLTKFRNGEINFSYSRSWLEWEGTMPVSLSLPLQEQAHKGAVVSAFFDNLLPDSQAILRGIAERVGATGIDAYSLLSAIGRDCVGALQFLPESEKADVSKKADYVTLARDDVRKILLDLKSVPLGIKREGGFRLSLAGAQEKAAFLWKNGQWCRPLGTMPTTHIFKPQIGKIEMSTGTIDLSQSVENEFYCLELLRAFGLKVAKAEIDQFGEKKVLIVERFDRLKRQTGDILRLPQEDMCQALGVPPTIKYQNMGGPSLIDVLNLLSRSDTPLKDQNTVFMSQILFWLIGATDGHAKNFSVFLRPNNQMALTPLYDVISAQPMFDARQIPHKDFRLAMSLGTKPHYKILEIQLRHFQQTAIKAGIEDVNLKNTGSFTTDVIKTIANRFDDAFETVLTKLPEDFPMEIHESIKSAASKRLELLCGSPN